jgi:EEF1A N-terminal glycine/lysine methyltransferase
MNGGKMCIICCTLPEWLVFYELTFHNSRLLPEGRTTGYDVAILSDLLHYHYSHRDLVISLELLLKKAPTSRVYVGAGRYTSLEVCQHFLSLAEERLGLSWEEGKNDGIWHGTMKAGSWTKEELGLRKANVRWWTGRWQ